MSPHRIPRESVLGVVAGALAVGLLLGFAAGASVAPRASAPTALPSTGTTDVMPDAVSQRLRDAYYGGGGSIATCLVAETIVCSRAAFSQTARHYDEPTRAVDAPERSALTAVHIPAGRVVVAGDFGVVDGAAMAQFDGGIPRNGHLLVAVNPDRQGIDYLDLGNLTSGTYLVSIWVPAWSVPTALLELVAP